MFIIRLIGDREDDIRSVHAYPIGSVLRTVLVSSDVFMMVS